MRRLRWWLGVPSAIVWCLGLLVGEIGYGIAFLAGLITSRIRGPPQLPSNEIARPRD